MHRAPSAKFRMLIILITRKQAPDLRYIYLEINHGSHLEICQRVSTCVRTCFYPNRHQITDDNRNLFSMMIASPGIALIYSSHSNRAPSSLRQKLRIACDATTPVSSVGRLRLIYIFTVMNIDMGRRLISHKNDTLLLCDHRITMPPPIARPNQLHTASSTAWKQWKRSLI